MRRSTASAGGSPQPGDGGSQIITDDCPIVFRDLAELHKTNAAKDSKAQEAALSLEMVALK